MGRVAVAIGVCLLVGWLGAGAAAAQGSLVVQAATEPPGLDLTATPASATAAVVHYNVQECLVKVDRHGKLVPWLAERWHTADNRNDTFFLKRGVHFHNGRELKAADVKQVIQRAMNPASQHPHGGHYASIDDVIVKGDYTVTFALKTITPSFLLTMAGQGSVIYPPEAADTLKSAPIGTGPFTLAEWVDAEAEWRIAYRADADAVVILAVFSKKTRTTPPAVIDACIRRLTEYDRA